MLAPISSADPSRSLSSEGGRLRRSRVRLGDYVNVTSGPLAGRTGNVVRVGYVTKDLRALLLVQPSDCGAPVGEPFRVPSFRVGFDA